MVLTFEAYDEVLFLNAVMALGCSLCISISTWPFRGLFDAWFFTNTVYDWRAHIRMTWFIVGCIALLFLNVQGIRLYEQDKTGEEAYQVIFQVNALMHLIWGLHNLHLVAVWATDTKIGPNFVNLRRPWPLLGYSVLGCCVSATVRNLYTLHNGYDETIVKVTWIWEWLSIALILGDLAYFLIHDRQDWAKLLQQPKKVL